MTVRAVDGQEDAQLAARAAEAGDHAGQRGTCLALVVQDWEGQGKGVGRFADGEPFVAPGEGAPGSLRERLVAQPGKRFRRAEAGARSADEQHACHRGRVPGTGTWIIGSRRVGLVAGHAQPDARRPARRGP